MLPVLVVIVFLVIFLGGIALGMFLMRPDDTLSSDIHRDDTQTNRTLTFPTAPPDDKEEAHR